MRPSRARTALAAVIGLLALVVAGLALATPAQAADAEVRINEFSSNNPDFIELINTGSSSVDLGGWVLKDNTENNSYTFPSGTTIAAGAIRGISGESVEFVFGLGNGDSVRLFNSGGTLIDSYTYAAHPPAGKSYGRCPDGTGAFVVTQASTKGTANACSTPDTAVKINEFSSNNPDFAELINTGGGPVDLSGWVLKDNTDNNSYTFPAGTSIAAGAIMPLSGESVQFVFGLGNGDSVRLFNSGGTSIDSYTYPAHPPAGKSYGRCPDGTGAFVITSAATKGTANSCPVPPGADKIKINEVQSDPGDLVELVNTGDTSMDLSGYKLKDNDDTHVFTITPGTTLAAHAYVVIDVNPSFGLGKGDSVRLYTPDLANLLDSTTYPADTHATDWGRCPDGTGAFGVTANTLGAANICGPVVPTVKINEIESNGDQVADWVELKNTGSTSADVSGWKILDNDPAHVPTPVVVPANTIIPAGGYYAIYTEIGQSPGFGLGGADSATLYLPDGTTQVDTYSWASHAATTYGRCPDGTGSFVTTTTSTRGLANACNAIRLNEIESNDPSGDDWIELKNVSSGFATIAGWKLRDVASGTTYAIPTLGLAGGNYVVIDRTAFGFDMTGSDTLQLLDESDTVIEFYSWASAATQTYGRCKDGVGTFTDTKSPTRGATNSCPGLETSPWPGPQTVSAADLTGTFTQDLSGLVFDPSNPDVLWAAQNKKGTLFKLVRDGGNNWVPAAGWPRDPKYLGGTGAPDTEGITIGPDGFVYLASERNNDASGVSRMSILRYDPSSPPGATIEPTSEWNLTSLIPAAGANLGLEGVTFVPDSYLVGHGFRDQSTNAPYDPATYPAHGNGLFFVAVEDTGDLIGFALDSDGSTAHKVATADSGFEHLADVNFDPERGRLWAVTDDTHDGRTSLLKIDLAGNFVVDTAYDRPVGMPNLNNEGLAIAPQSRCVNGLKEVVWSDDGDTGGNSIRRGAINCTPPAAQNVVFTSTPPASPVAGDSYTPTATGGGSGNPVIISIAEGSASICSLDSGPGPDTVHFDHAGTCTINASQAAAQGYLAGSASQQVVVGKAGQTITFAQPGNTTYGGADVLLNASSDAGLPVTLTSETPSICTVTGSLAHPVGAGTCTITASQDGDADHLAATPMQRSFQVAKAPITMTTKASSGLLSLLTWRITYTSTVRSTVTGLPVAGVPVTTKINNGAASTGCTANTNASGVATCTAGPINIALLAPFTATAAATADHLGGSASGVIGLF